LTHRPQLVAALRRLQAADKHNSEQVLQEKPAGVSWFEELR
jgi:hypothetical protein